MQDTISYTEEIINYYDTCWLERFKSGHNPKSLAMHMGYFDGSTADNDEAKNNMNLFLAQNLEVTGAPAGKVIVDAGCGVGGTCLFLAGHFAGLDITGINISAPQIALAKEFISKRPGLKSEIKFLQEDYCSTSLASGSVDAIYTIESLCHAPVKQQFYKEAFRVLKPGGILLIIDYVDTLQNVDARTAEMRSVFQKGWTVNEYISKPAEDLAGVAFEQVSIKSIKPGVMPGILKSYDGAMKKISALNGSIPEIMRKHLDACIALKHLAQTGVIDYCIIKGRKP
jgi:tocopherol O-methyltransferase